MLTQTQDDRCRLLLLEMRHRVYNGYCAVIGELSLASAVAPSDEAKAALGAVAERLHEYVALHRALEMPDGTDRIDLGNYLGKLCRAISHSLLFKRAITLTFLEQNIALQADRCWIVGLIVSELVTNAAKHAFGDGAGGIRIEIVRATDHIECTVSDNGRCESVLPGGSGSKIVRALAANIGGSVHWTFAGRGTTAILKFGLVQDSAALLNLHRGRDACHAGERRHDDRIGGGASI
jgi:two-component sensor histidine kinase